MTEGWKSPDLRCSRTWAFTPPTRLCRAISPQGEAFLGKRDRRKPVPIRESGEISAFSLFRRKEGRQNILQLRHKNLSENICPLIRGIQLLQGLEKIGRGKIRGTILH